MPEQPPDDHEGLFPEGQPTQPPLPSYPESPGGYAPPPPPGSYHPGAPPWGYPLPGVPVSPFAGYGIRVGAWLIDWLIVTVVGVLLVLPFHGIRRIHQVVGNVNTTTLHLQPGAVLVNIVLVLAYGTVLCGSARGQTLGMAAVGARAVRAADGGAIGYGRALGRAAFEYLMAILLFFPWVIDMLFPLWDSRNQTLHDKVMDTVVVKV